MLWRRAVVCLGVGGAVGCTNDFVVSDPRDGGAGGGGGAGGACAGECVPVAPLGWSQPALLWTGPIEEAPPCPVLAPTIGYEGYDGFGTPLACSPCACEQAADVTCALPTTLTASSAPCSGGPGASMTAFNAPNPWDGACSSDDAIPAGVLCNGSPCVRSLTIAAPVAASGPCAPKPQVPPPAESAFNTFARACLANAYPPCGAADEVCAAGPAPSGFAQCIFARGDVACPEAWGDKHVYFEKFADLRGCAPCGCGPSEGATCMVSVEVHSDNACAMTPLVQVQVSSAAPPACFDLPPGTALGSKAAQVVSGEPGTCPATGGEPLGEVEPSEPATFCCRPALTE